MEYTFERINPYRVTFEDVRQSSNAVLSAFRHDNLFAAKLGLPKEGRVSIYQHIVLQLIVWPNLLLTDRLKYVVKHHNKIVAFSIWECPTLPLHDNPSWYLRLRHFVIEKAVGVLSEVVFAIFAVFGLAPHPNRKDVSDFVKAFNEALPLPKDYDAFLDTMAVDEKYQRKGLGGKLFQFGIDNITEYCAMDGRKPPNLVLYASPQGKGLYLKYGFKPTGDVELAIGNGGTRVTALMIRDRQL